MSLLAAVERPVMALVRVLGLALLAGVVAAGVGALYRSYAREEIPEGLAVLVGLGVVGGWLNTTTALRQFLGTGETVPPPEVVVINVAAFVLGAAAAALGAKSGARFVGDAYSLTREGDVGRLVQSVGRFVTVELPDEIDDIDGYEPLDPETVEALTGASLRFPRGLTVAELRDRLAARLRDDYGVGHVDVELADDGTVEFLAAGGRAVGLGPTLAPGTVAVAVRADPAFSASAGDLVQVWRRGEPSGGDSTGENGNSADDGNTGTDDDSADSERSPTGPKRIATAELRATVGDVATLALDADAAADIDHGASYRLVTLPTEPRADREFSARLRAADETVGVVTLAADSPLVGAPVGSLDATVVAVRDADGVETIPADDRLLAPDDTLYVVARPDLLRRVEAAASGATAGEGGATPPSRRD